jgi:histidine triad (HIT) family protein
VRGEAAAHKVYEDDETLAFMDIFPVTDGHTLVIPKAHCENVFAATPAQLRAVMQVAKKTADAMHAALQPAGLMVFQLNGAAAGQSVFHYHMHLMPRSPDEPLALHSRVPGDPARLQEMARRIAAAIGN